MKDLLDCFQFGMISIIWLWVLIQIGKKGL
jgi:hypothetical protein